MEIVRIDGKFAANIIPARDINHDCGFINDSIDLDEIEQFLKKDITLDYKTALLILRITEECVIYEKENSNCISNFKTTPEGLFLGNALVEIKKNLKEYEEFCKFLQNLEIPS